MQLVRASLLLLALLAGAADARRNAPPQGEAGKFDYYALSLSWSPAYCASHSDPNQCGRQLGFVLHGLWPQYQKGYPQSCSTEKLSADVKRRYAPLFPSAKLIDHEWPKHGTCSGLSPTEYFELSAKLKDGLKIPAAYQQPAAPVRTTNAEFSQAFKSANPGMADNSLLPFCTSGGRILQELHACYDKQGAPQSCGANEIKRSQSSCGQGSFLLPSVR